MNKNDVRLALNECFEKDGNCAVLYLLDGTSLIIQQKPAFFNVILRIELNFKHGDEIIKETVILPYSSIMYITITSFENMEKFSEIKG